jgi:UDP-N-acetylglucosamine 2-epimerase (non-hydrolysing)
MVDVRDRIIRIMCVVGTRPNFMKIAPFMHEILKHSSAFDVCLVHTGQHYDENMSGSFFMDLGIPEPDICLNVGSGSHAVQVGMTMIEFEKALNQWRPDWVVVVGDVNATCACSLTAKKMGIMVAHIEAGLRSFDRTMPEEINRIVTDRITDLYLTPDKIADQHLLDEGVEESKINCVGNIMIDTLEANRAKAEALDICDIVTSHLVNDCSVSNLSSLQDNRYAVMTLHRPSNVDDPIVLSRLVRYITDDFSRKMPVIWSIHPRTKKRLQDYEIWSYVMSCPSVFLVEPLSYHEMLRVNMTARVVLTDSGGLQEECCVLGTPCITLRENTERPVTLSENGGLSWLVGNDVEKIKSAFASLPDKLDRVGFRPPLWDGSTAERIVDIFLSMINE